MSYKQKIQELIQASIQGYEDKVFVEKPKLKEHGDLSTNIAMILAKDLKKDPMEIANEIKEKVKNNSSLVSHVEIAKPGFVNFIVSDFALASSLVEVITSGENYGLSKKKIKGKILIEYVSSNPTGDLHIGHGRQAVIGSSLVNLLRAAGYEVQSEFYINDFGEQIAKLSETVLAIYRKLKSESYEWKEDFYPEEIILPYVKKVLEENKEGLNIESLGEVVKDVILKAQKELLSSLGINFDKWFSETELHRSNKVLETLKKIQRNTYTYEDGGAIWFKAKEFGDSRDRVLLKKDGHTTYLLSDIAYHVDKLSRGFTHLITIWGADHHGQEISLKGGLKSIGLDDKKLEIVFVQLVSLKQEGQEVKMSKRGGNFVTIEEVLNEVGKDAFRFFLIENHANNRMIFDIDLAKKQDKENPVFYIQYAHARCCSIFRQLTAPFNISQTIDELMNLFRINNQEYAATKSLIVRILDFPDEITQAANSRSPNRIANYLKDLAMDFHILYTTCRVITKDINLTQARLALINATKITIANGLKILGINAPEAM